MAEAPVELDLGMAPGRFLSRHWQKRPLLVRGALPAVAGRVDADELAGLACEELVESRIVRGGEAGPWTLEHGPVPEHRFQELGDAGWTLLVQDADKLLASVEAVLPAFAFIPEWRIDDVMISFAAPGGSVGPHLDHYDVFLVQAQGRRRWRIDTRPGADPTLVSGQPLKILARFDPDRDWVLEPGDLLYLPPGVPHHGVALDPCLTWSVGMRAPSVEEALIDWVESRAAGLDEARRYRDPELRPAAEPGRIDAETVARFVSLLERELEFRDPDFRHWLGSFLTRYRLGHAAAPDPTRDRPRVEGPLYRHPWSRFAWMDDGDGALLFVSGERWSCSRAAARVLCARRILDGATVRQLAADRESRRLLDELLRAGHLTNHEP